MERSTILGRKDEPQIQGSLFEYATMQHLAASRKGETRMEHAITEPRPSADPLRESVDRAQDELDKLKIEKYEAEANLSILTEQIKKREEYLRVAVALLEDAPVHEIKAVPDLPQPLELGAAIALRGLPRDGYGAITQAVVRLLNHHPQGLNVPTLAAMLQRAGFQVKGQSYEAAVRSALKNLRNRKIASYNDARGRYMIEHSAAS